MPTIEQARSWYQDADPIHDFDHVLRVHNMAGRLAQIESADHKIVSAAALLHDAQGSAPGEEDVRASHHEESAKFANEVLQRECWPKDQIDLVIHCIRAHRYRSTEAPTTIEAKVLFDSDKLDVLGAIGAARTIGYAVLAGQPIISRPSQQFIETGEKEQNEPHSSYHEFLFKLVNVKKRLYTKSGLALAESRHDFLVRYYEQLLAEIDGNR